MIRRDCFVILPIIDIGFQQLLIIKLGEIMSHLAATTNLAPSRMLLTVKQFAERHSFLTESSLRFQIFNRASNGLESSGAIVRLGRKILIDEHRYFAWVDSQQGRQHG